MMKKYRPYIGLLMTTLAVGTAFSAQNKCIKDIESHYYQICTFGNCNTPVLNLSNCDISDNDIDAITTYLAGKNTWVIVNLHNNNIGKSGATKLAAYPKIPNLNLNANKIGNDGAIALSFAQQFVVLQLDENGIGDAGVKALAANKNITSLTLRHNQFGMAGIEALADNQTLTELDVSDNKVTSQGAIKLAKNRSLAIITANDNLIDNEGARALAQNSNKSDKYFTLRLDHNRINDAAVFAGNHSMRYTVSVNDNAIGSQGISALAAMKNLFELNIAGNQLGDEGFAALASNKSLRLLDVRNNHITAKGAKAFIKQLKSLRSSAYFQDFDISHNQLEDDGAAAIGNVRAEYLRIDDNNIHDAGAIALTNTYFGKELDVQNNQIGRKGINALWEYEATSRVAVRLEGNPGTELTSSQ